MSASPAIDAAENSAGLTTDQRGRPREKDGDGVGQAMADMGAFER